jgi:hypothetical protein
MIVFSEGFENKGMGLTRFALRRSLGFFGLRVRDLSVADSKIIAAIALIIISGSFFAFFCTDLNHYLSILRGKQSLIIK